MKIKASEIIRDMEVSEDGGWPVGLKQLKKIRRLTKLLETRHVLFEKDFIKEKQ